MAQRLDTDRIAMTMTPSASGTFSPSEAALSLIELARRQPQFVIRYSVATMVLMLCLGMIAAASGLGAAAAEFQAIGQSGRAASPAQLGAILNKVDAGALVGWAALFVLANVALTASALRKTVLDTETGPLGLGFGADEVRLLGATGILVSLFLAATFALALVIGLIATAVPAVATISPVAAVLVFTLLAGRFCQYGVLSVAQGRVAVRESWSHTRPVFWRLVGAHVLWTVIYMMTVLVVGALLGLVLGAAEPPRSLGEFLRPGHLVGEVATGLIQGLGTLGSVCVGAYAWHQMRASAEA